MKRSAKSGQRDAAAGTILTPDICVIGAGSAGLSVAAAAAAFGVSVSLVERGLMGGDCLNTGCIPSKALIAAARHAADIRNAPHFGVSAGEPVVDFAAVMARLRTVIAAIAPTDSAARFTGLGVTVIAAEARFVDRRTIAAGDTLIRARRFVIATGSAPLVPPIPGLGDVPFLTNETLFDLGALPPHLLIIGGGAVGMEMGQAFRRLGAAVTIVESNRVLAHDDNDLTAIVLARLRREGVVVEEATRVTGASASGDEITLRIEQDGAARTIRGSHLLVAAGREPRIENLGLEAAGIATTAKGIVVGQDLRTANRRVYAIGDVTGGEQFTHVAGYEAGLAVRAILFRLPIRRDSQPIPHVTYTDPELAQVGLTERQARDRKMPVTVLAIPYGENDRARTDGTTEGLLKLIVSSRGRILGAGAAGEKSGELINLFSLALSRRLSVQDLQGFISPYPSYGEIGKRASTAYFAHYADNRIIRSVVQFLARLG